MDLLVVLPQGVLRRVLQFAVAARPVSGATPPYVTTQGTVTDHLLLAHFTRENLVIVPVVTHVRDSCAESQPALVTHGLRRVLAIPDVGLACFFRDKQAQTSAAGTRKGRYADSVGIFEMFNFFTHA